MMDESEDCSRLCQILCSQNSRFLKSRPEIVLMALKLASDDENNAPRALSALKSANISKGEELESTTVEALLEITEKECIHASRWHRMLAANACPALSKLLVMNPRLKKEMLSLELLVLCAHRKKFSIKQIDAALFLLNNCAEFPRGFAKEIESWMHLVDLLGDLVRDQRYIRWSTRYWPAIKASTICIHCSTCPWLHIFL